GRRTTALALTSALSRITSSCLTGAESGLMHRSKPRSYSITRRRARAASAALQGRASWGLEVDHSASQKATGDRLLCCPGQIGPPRRQALPFDRYATARKSAIFDRTGRHGAHPHETDAPTNTPHDSQGGTCT